MEPTVNWSRTPPTSFDGSLSLFANAIAAVRGIDFMVSGTFIRDASGLLVFASHEEVSDSDIQRVLKALPAGATAYVRADRPIVAAQHPAIARLIDGAFSLSEEVYLPEGPTYAYVPLVDRRIVGTDWLSAPVQGWAPPSAGRLVFASMKGGVGRSTALAILAADLAYRNKNVLVVDLDLEAPGIGSMLVAEEDLPAYGVLDWMVESNLRDLDDTFLADMVAPSRVSDGRGLIDVVPAIGRTSEWFSGNVLAKIGRAYLDSTHNEQSLTFLGKCQDLIEQLSARRQYDAVLIDARAGLHETTAASILGLGADVLLFGIDTSQTFTSYRYLFSHLENICIALDTEAASAFISRLRFVHAKATKDELDRKAFRDRAYELFADRLYPLMIRSEDSDSTEELPLLSDVFSLDSEEAPHFAWPVYASLGYMEFDPQRPQKDHQLEPRYYEELYGDFLAAAWDRLRLERAL
ncbi:ParA family protein [Ralstonia mojiangensis]|uniref:ParA family protein n=1 Tax=Ralstonia mojiangensis TaxID=2953895 RepID=UPI0021B179BF|nr:ParA family protein [Ralstonia mojiangensis]MCT7325885.1 ParA family protein [Ralstonia mojiangensis]